MPDWEPTNDNLGDPGFKQWLQGAGTNGGGRRGVARPGSGPGGGYGAFFGMPGVAPSNMSQGGMRTLRRRIGFQPMIGASQPSTPSSMAVPSAMESYSASGSTPTGSMSAMRAPTPMASSHGFSGMIQNAINQSVQRTQQAAGGNAGGVNTTSWGGLAGNADPNWSGLLWRLIGQGGQAGAFDPMGSQAMENMARERVMADSGARQRQARLSADLSGGSDPSLSGVGELLATLGTASDASRAGSDAKLQSAQAAQDYIRNLLGNEFASEFTRLNGMASNWNNQQSGGMGNWLAQLGGSLLGRTGL